MVVLNVILSSSPRNSAGEVDLDDVLGLMVTNVSRRVCSWKVLGVSAVAMTLKHSRGEMASDVADRKPILSQARYLMFSHVSSSVRRVA